MLRTWTQYRAYGEVFTLLCFLVFGATVVRGLLGRRARA
jgi:hypothetical protein